MSRRASGAAPRHRPPAASSIPQPVGLDAPPAAPELRHAKSSKSRCAPVVLLRWDIARSARRLDVEPRNVGRRSLCLHPPSTAAEKWSSQPRQVHMGSIVCCPSRHSGRAVAPAPFGTYPCRAQNFSLSAEVLYQDATIAIRTQLATRPSQPLDLESHASCLQTDQERLSMQPE